MERYCTEKELEVGKVYYGYHLNKKEEFKNDIWIYLGKNSKEEYVWLNVEDDSVFVKNPKVVEIYKHLENIEITKNIKEVKPIEGILCDKDFFIGLNVKSQAPNFYKYAKMHEIFKIKDIEKFGKKELDRIRNM